MKLIDLTGKRFDRLTVIRRVFPNAAKSGNARWICRCSCGKEKIVLGCSLISKDTKSCGCLRNENVSKANSLRSGLASLRLVLNSYKWNAKKKGLVFELTEKQFERLTSQECYYCGVKPANIQQVRGYNGKYVYNGLDRIDNTKGYTIDNVVPCCVVCNYSKRTKTLQEYRDFIERSYNKMFGSKEKK